MRAKRSLSTVLLAMSIVLVAACEDEPDRSDSRSAGLVDAADDDAGSPVSAVADTRDDIDCDPETLGEDDEILVVNARYVVGGELGGLCFGDDDPTLADAWAALSTFTTPLDRADLAVFTGFVAQDPDAEEATLAYVSVLDDEGFAFQMSVDLDQFDVDPDEALITLAHEFSHVFTALDSQLDRSPEAEDDCTTYYNGDGCYRPDSIMANWIDEFWGDGRIDQVDPFADARSADGQDRCDTDPGFFGAYAASTPEEDFAESFGAFVFRVDVTSPEQQARLDFMAARPGLAEYRDRAVASELGPLPNRFDACGEAA